MLLGVVRCEYREVGLLETVELQLQVNGKRRR